MVIVFDSALEVASFNIADPIAKWMTSSPDPCILILDNSVMRVLFRSTTVSWSYLFAKRKNFGRCLYRSALTVSFGSS